MIRRHPCSGILSGTSYRIAKRITGFALLCSCAFSAELPDFAGSWKFDPARSANRETAVEAFVAQVDSADRAPLRERLLEVSRFPVDLSITLEKDKVRIAGDGGIGDVSPADGSVVDLSMTAGAPLKRQLAFEAGTMTETYRAEDGSRTNRYGLSQDGKTLFVDVSVVGGSMPIPVAFRLVYSRQPTSTRQVPRKAASDIHPNGYRGCDGRFFAQPLAWKNRALDGVL